MGKAVFHISKRSGTSHSGIGNHIDRDIEHKHTFENSDLTKLHLNEHMKINDYCNLPLMQAVERRIEDAQLTRKPQANSVRHIEIILSGSHQEMKDIYNSPMLWEHWKRMNLEFISEKFGAENIVRFTAHVDEKTPHIHCIIVPVVKSIDKKGKQAVRLSADKLIGNRNNLARLHTLYHEQVGQYFGLERGEKSEAKHIEPGEYRKIISSRKTKISEIAQKSDAQLINYASLGVLSEKLKDIDRSLKKAESDLLAREITSKSNISVIKSNFSVIKSQEKKKHQLKSEIEELTETLKNKENKYQKLKEDFKEEMRETREYWETGIRRVREDSLNYLETRIDEATNKLIERQSELEELNDLKNFRYKLYEQSEELKEKEMKLNKKETYLNEKENNLNEEAEIIRRSDEKLSKNIEAYNIRVTELNNEIKKRRGLGYSR